MENDELGCDSFPNTMKGESCVSLVEFGVRDRRRIDDRLVVTKHVARGADWDSEIAKRITEVNDLLNTCSSCNEFRPIGCSLNRGLLLRVSINGCAIDEMQYGSNGSASEHVVIQVGINIMCSHHSLA